MAVEALQVPRFGSTGTEVGDLVGDWVGDGVGVASTAAAGKVSETISAGTINALEKTNFRDFIPLKINRAGSITWLAHRI